MKKYKIKNVSTRLHTINGKQLLPGNELIIELALHIYKVLSYLKDELIITEEEVKEETLKEMKDDESFIPEVIKKKPGRAKKQ